MCTFKPSNLGPWTFKLSTQTQKEQMQTQAEEKNIAANMTEVQPMPVLFLFLCFLLFLLLLLPQRPPKFASCPHSVKHWNKPRYASQHCMLCANYITEIQSSKRRRLWELESQQFVQTMIFLRSRAEEMPHLPRIATQKHLASHPAQRGPPHPTSP